MSPASCRPVISDSGPGGAGFDSPHMPSPLESATEVVQFVSVTSSLYETLALRGGAGDGTRHERMATVFEIVRGHEAVLTKLRLSRERWIVWVQVDHLRLGGAGKYRGRQLQFVTVVDGTSVIGECRSNRFLDERCRVQRRTGGRAPGARVEEPDALDAQLALRGELRRRVAHPESLGAAHPSGDLRALRRRTRRSRHAEEIPGARAAVMQPRVGTKDPV